MGLGIEEEKKRLPACQLAPGIVTLRAYSFGCVIYYCTAVTSFTLTFFLPLSSRMWSSFISSGDLGDDAPRCTANIFRTLSETRAGSSNSSRNPACYADRFFAHSEPRRTYSNEIGSILASDAGQAIVNLGTHLNAPKHLFEISISSKYPSASRRNIWLTGEPAQIVSAKQSNACGRSDHLTASGVGVNVEDPT
jgi:hypothetical protein